MEYYSATNEFLACNNVDKNIMGMKQTRQKSVYCMNQFIVLPYNSKTIVTEIRLVVA